MLMGSWVGHLTDVNGAFLHGQFPDGEEIYMKVPQGFEKFYPGDVLWKLCRCLYGLKQAAMALWQELLKCMKSMGMNQSNTDPCLNYKWTNGDLVLIPLCIDDNLIVGSKESVSEIKKELMK